MFKYRDVLYYDKNPWLLLAMAMIVLHTPLQISSLLMKHNCPVAAVLVTLVGLEIILNLAFWFRRCHKYELMAKRLKSNGIRL